MMGDIEHFPRCNIILSNNHWDATYFLFVDISFFKGAKRTMKSAISFLVLAVLCGNAMVSAQQKSPGPQDAVKAVTPVKDTIVKKDSIAALHFGRISLATAPETADVSVDSVFKGTSPLTLDSMAPGGHVLIVKRKGYFGKKISLEVKADSTISVNISLVKPGSFVITSTPSGAKVVLDGKESGVTPWENSKLKPGDHALRLEKDQYVPLEMTIAAAEGKTDSLSFSLVALKPQPAALAQASQPAPVKHGFDTTILIVLASLFVVFGIVIFAAESGSK
jgi:PEGA domain